MSRSVRLYLEDILPAFLFCSEITQKNRNRVFPKNPVSGSRLRIVVMNIIDFRI
jgi:hypothetical protein